MISVNCVAERDTGKGLPVLSARQFIGAATTALSLITGAFLLATEAGGSWHATLTPQQAGAGCGPITREIKVRPGFPKSRACSSEADRNRVEAERHQFNERPTTEEGPGRTLRWRDHSMSLIRNGYA